MTRENMKSELTCSRECKIEGRQSIHARKMSKTAPTRNGDVGTNAHIAEDGFSITLQSSGDCVKYAKSQREMENNDGKTGIVTSIDGQLCMSEVMKAIDETPETKHLKDLLLLHLDWSQQQQESILSKDKQIQALLSERDALKCRLDRMERRMSILRQKGPGANGSPAVRDSPRAITPMSDGRECRGQKRKLSLEPQNLSKRFSSTLTRRDRTGSVDRERGSRGAAMSGGGDMVPAMPCTMRRTRLTSEMSDSLCSVASSPRHNQSRSCENTETENTEDDDLSQLPKTRNFFRKKWQADSMTATEALQRTRKLRQIVFRRTRQGREDAMLRTGNMYYVTEHKEQVQVACLSPVKPEVEQLKVPSWRIHQVPTGYQLEGTENLDDEIFLKRHQKPEQEERRRKRWDMQRIREQHRYEKLQGRAPEVSGARSDSDHPCTSFLPDPDDVKFIEVTDRIPVSAFGYPIPVLKASEFSLPWFDMDKRDRHEKKVGRPKKHR